MSSVKEPLGESAGDLVRTRPMTSVLDAVVKLDGEGAVVEFSPAAEALFGVARAEAIGRDLVDLIVPAELRESVRYCLAGGEGEPPREEGELLGRRLELPARRLDTGAGFRAELTIVRAAAEGGGPTVIARDVSHREEMERTRGHMELVVAGTQDAVLSKDLNGIVLTWNPAAERLYGYTAEEAIGRHVSFLMPAELKHEVEDILTLVRRGEFLDTHETRRVRKDGSKFDVALTISPIAGPDGTPAAASVIARDITGERRRRRARDLLIAATRDLDASLDPVETARNIVAKAVPQLAEVCIIDFIRPDGRIGDSVAASAIVGAAEQLERIRLESPLDPEGDHPVAQVLRADEPMIWRDLSRPEVVDEVAQTDEHRALMDDTGYESAAVVGLVARGRRIGALSFLHANANVRYEEADLEFLGELGERAALALDNARLYQERDAIARNLQRGLRPPRPARVEGLESAVVFEAAGRGIEIGGDLYDVLPTEDGCWVLVGDVAGKGSAAAGVSVAVRHAVRGLTREVDEPEEVLVRVNELLVEGTGLNDFATAVLVRLREDASGHWTLAAACAGHPPPVHVRKGGARLLGGGTVLGALNDAKVQRHDAAFEHGDTLVFCTDGWLEAGPPPEHRDPLELARLAEYLAPLALEEMIARLRGDAVSRTDGELQDDIVLLALRRL
ncbi:MAG TPA: SpoIIE family protein phosphatase [Solirubrobacterales bacterium]|nr:SpoIIE family protein phosphatase [Solirubrobacterales bacterium]